MTAQEKFDENMRSIVAYCHSVGMDKEAAAISSIPRLARAVAVAYSYLEDLEYPTNRAACEAVEKALNGTE